MDNILDDCVDVSDAQGIIDWPAVAASGIRVAFLKAVQGHTFEAHHFRQNWEGVLATGLITPIPYDFLAPLYEAEQIAFFKQVAGLGPGSICMIDWEGRAADTCSPQEAEDIGRAILVETGRLPVGYWGEDGSTPRPPTPYMRTFPRDVPRYPIRGITKFSEFSQSIQANPLRWVPGALFWQYTSVGVVPGITGPVDRSVWIGTQAERDAWIKDGTMPARFSLRP